ncbi:tetratricopeptide repeat protein [bacterium]|nr:tetratricopeptide repeat protein [bacterium]
MTTIPLRKLAAIMFTDIAGFTALSADNEDKALKLLDRQREILQPIVKQFDGEWLKEIGDGLLLSFSSSKNAVFCAIEIQKVTKEIDDLNLRIGIHQGDILAKDGDVFGDDVNIASRLEPFAAIGGIVISDKVQRDILGTPEIITKYIGKPKLKGVKQELSVYCLISHDLPETDLSKVTAKLEKDVKKLWFNQKIIVAAILVLFVAVGGLYTIINQNQEVPSIGILLMENRGETDDDFWVSGITEDLIIKVAGAGLIRVTPLKTILDINPVDKFEDIAKNLRVKYLLISSLQKLEDSFELRCQIIEAKSGISVFANKWTESFNNSPRIVGNIADNILKILKVSTNQEITEPPTTNTEAYEYYLKAKYKYQKRQNLEDIEIARGLFQKAIELDDALLQAKLGLGVSYQNTGDIEKAMSFYEKALKQAKESGNNQETGHSLNNIGVIYYEKGDNDKALDYHMRSLEIFEKLGDKRRIGRSLDNIGIIYTIKGAYEKALDYQIRSLEIFEELGDKRQKAISLNHIGNFYDTKGEYDKALEYHTHSLEIREEIGDKRGIGGSLNNIGVIYENKGNSDKAMEYYTLALEIKEELGNKRGIGVSLNNIGTICYENGDYDKALVYFTRSLEIDEELGDKQGIGISLYNVGLNYNEKGDYDQALVYFTRSLRIKEEVGDKQGIGWSLNSIGNNFSLKGDYDNALIYFTRSQEIFEELDNESGLEISLNNVGFNYYDKGDYNQAIEYLDKSLAIKKENGLKDNESLLGTTIGLFLSYKQLGREFDLNEIDKFINETEKIEYDLNYRIFELLDDQSFLETAYKQTQKIVDGLDDSEKFLNYPIPKAIAEAWESIEK